MRMILTLVAVFLIFPYQLLAVQISEDTEGCLACHELVTPGIVADWKNSRHSQVSPALGMAKKARERRISAVKVDDSLAETAVGCAECHSINADSHPGSFEHNGYTVHTVVSPADCATCHPVEVEEYGENLMSQAFGNLMGNPLYMKMVDAVNGLHEYSNGVINYHGSNEANNADSCLSCHGTEVKITGTETRETSMGEMDFPSLTNWPNVGVGRVNPDGTLGSCSPCHARHQYSIEVARKPYTCAQCHKGPDVPAYKVYSASVHGNIQKAIDKKWNYEAVPWTVGTDFTAPTCATCHISLVVDEEGEVLAERTHRMNDRLPWRLFGLPYAHPHPVAADTTPIINSAGLHLPTELSGEPVSKFLIDTEEMAARQETMAQVCLGCHGRQWVDGHFDRLETSIASTNHMTLQATRMLTEAWEEGLAKDDNPFDEVIEIKWTEQWLFFGNSTRLASAMGGTDYGVFDNGRWWQHKNIQEIREHLLLLGDRHKQSVSE
ncbi:MAG: multiheme c-type cytochrome [Desulforhopalus sp.]